MSKSVHALVAIPLLLIVLIAGAMPPAHAQNTAVELELVLAVDTSASVDNKEYRLQMNGVAQAFRDPAR